MKLAEAVIVAASTLYGSFPITACAVADAVSVLNLVTRPSLIAATVADTVRCLVGVLETPGEILTEAERLFCAIRDSCAWAWLTAESVFAAMREMNASTVAVASNALVRMRSASNSADMVIVAVSSIRLPVDNSADDVMDDCSDLAMDLMLVADVVIVELRRFVMSRLMLAAVVTVADSVLANIVSMLRLAETVELAINV
jgi:hypothetical protein